MEFNMNKAHAGIVFGGGRGIGLSLVKESLEANSHLRLWATFRDEERSAQLFELARRYEGRLAVKRVDPAVEADLIEAKTWLKSSLKDSFPEQATSLDFVLVANGVLHNDTISPEKSLRDIDLEVLQEVFKVNCFIAPLVAKHFTPLFSRSSASLFAALSAKVGSIADNAMGGWYGYRASKAGLNMFLKTIAIELERTGRKTAVVAIHPGTTKTDLSRPFIARTKYRLWEPDEAARNILRVVNAPIGPNALFLGWDGQDIPW